MSYAIGAGKRLAIEESEWLDDWFMSASPRNGNSHAEGQWCQWVHLARLILASDMTAEQMPSFHLAYPDAPHLYDESHPDCVACAAKVQDIHGKGVMGAGENGWQNTAKVQEADQRPKIPIGYFSDEATDD